MRAREESQYRLNLAEGFVAEAREDLSLKRWRSCVDNSQLAVENAAKVALALLGPVGRTHDPAKLIRKQLGLKSFPQQFIQRLNGLRNVLNFWDPKFTSAVTMVMMRV